MQRITIYTFEELEQAGFQARCHFLRRRGVTPSVAAHVANDVSGEAWRIMMTAVGRQYAEDHVSALTSRYLRWNRGKTPHLAATFT